MELERYGNTEFVWFLWLLECCDEVEENERLVVMYLIGQPTAKLIEIDA